LSRPAGGVKCESRIEAERKKRKDLGDSWKKLPETNRARKSWRKTGLFAWARIDQKIGGQVPGPLASKGNAEPLRLNEKKGPRPNKFQQKEN